MFAHRSVYLHVDVEQSALWLSYKTKFPSSTYNPVPPKTQHIVLLLGEWTDVLNLRSISWCCADTSAVVLLLLGLFSEMFDISESWKLTCEVSDHGRDKWDCGHLTVNLGFLKFRDFSQLIVLCWYSGTCLCVYLYDLKTFIFKHQCLHLLSTPQIFSFSFGLSYT